MTADSCDETGMAPSGPIRSSDAAAVGGRKSRVRSGREGKRRDLRGAAAAEEPPAPDRGPTCCKIFSFSML